MDEVKFCVDNSDVVGLDCVSFVVPREDDVRFMVERRDCDIRFQVERRDRDIMFQVENDHGPVKDDWWWDGPMFQVEDVKPKPKPKPKVDTADIMRLIDGLRYNASKLRGYGFSREKLLSIMDDEVKYSRIHIDSRYDIHLTDCDDRILELEPLAKTVFFFFLIHTEGVRFKDMSDHTDEIRSIYSKVTGRESEADINESVKRLVNPMDNSINEKSSRIASVLKKTIDGPEASDYCIQGGRGERRFISIDRSLVSWDQPL